MNGINFFDLDFVARRCEYDQVYTLQFLPRQPIPFKAGQWAHVGFLPGNDAEMVEHRFSFASAPEDSYVEFSMDFSSGSDFKKWMDKLNPGDSIKVFRINGDFVVNPSAQEKIVFLSGGIGITPVRSIVRDLHQRGINLEWSLVHVARTEFLYEVEFSRFASAQWRVHRDGLERVWDNIMDDPDNTRYFVSGSERFVEAMKEKLMYSDIGSSQIVTESFL